MYHLLYDSNSNDFIVVRDTDYSTSDWKSTILELKWQEKRYHWSSKSSMGKPIEEVLYDRTLLSSANSFEELIAKQYEENPELFI